MRKLAILLLTFSLTACGEPVVVVSSTDTFCTRVDRHHSPDDERAALKRAAVAEPGIVPFIRWGAAIIQQWDEKCLRPAKGQ